MCQHLVDGIEEHVSSHIIFRSYPFSLQDKASRRYSDVGNMRTGRRSSPSLSPYCVEFLNSPITMQVALSSTKKGLLVDAEGKAIEETDNLVNSYPLCSGGINFEI